MDLIGRKINKWLVLKQVRSSQRGIHFECRCECGYEKIIPKNPLINGKTRQCSFCQKKGRINVGDKYGKWLILSESIERTIWGARRYNCKCECGFIKIIDVGDLRQGKSTQCTSCHISNKNTSHGRSKTATYRTWAGIIGRCTNPNNTDYKLYGGRGISVYEPWKKFENFLTDMGEKPPKLEIDRIDPDGDYEPKNCRWVTRQENVDNRRMSATNRPKYLLVAKEKLCNLCLGKLKLIESSK